MCTILNTVCMHTVVRNIPKSGKPDVIDVGCRARSWCNVLKLDRFDAVFRYTPLSIRRLPRIELCRLRLPTGRIEKAGSKLYHLDHSRLNRTHTQDRRWATLQSPTNQSNEDLTAHVKRACSGFWENGARKAGDLQGHYVDNTIAETCLVSYNT